MFSSCLGRRSRGSLITGPGDYRAYLPNPLPPSIKLGRCSYPRLSEVERAMERLEALGAVSLAAGERRNRVYCARAILDVLEELP